jgi:hypothetical protein
MLATVLGLPVGKVRVQYYEGSGTFGHSCYEDNMFASESELRRIIGPFSRIITSSFANGQQSPDRTCVIRTKIVMRHSFYHPIPVIRVATSAQVTLAGARHNALKGRGRFSSSSRFAVQ